MSALDAEETARRLELRPHPEGGFYRETFRSPLMVTLPDGRVRHASTAIHFLLPAGTHSTWHRVAADEVWHHYDGGALWLYRLGLPDLYLDAGTPQAVVPAGVWQAAEPVSGAVLVGCTVAPGFDFADFVLGDADRLGAEFPGEAALIRRLAE
ncbi:MAG TPA: cupin domain-containing protein [Gemmatimonadales bacterium]|nr:cupin domain-containing protein [Gemmatimonadales bacterium]